MLRLPHLLIKWRLTASQFAQNYRAAHICLDQTAMMDSVQLAAQSSAKVNSVSNFVVKLIELVTKFKFQRAIGVRKQRQAFRLMDKDDEAAENANPNF